MSGIFGIFRFDGDRVAERDVERLGEAMAYRGPDGRETATAGPIGLGRCLMRVTPEDAFDVRARPEESE